MCAHSSEGKVKLVFWKNICNFVLEGMREILPGSEQEMLGKSCPATPSFDE